MEMSTLKESASPVMTRDEKIEQIVHTYRKGDLQLPSCPKLERDFAGIMGSLNRQLSSAAVGMRLEIKGSLDSIYKTLVHGIGPRSSPEVPSTGKGLYEFIRDYSNPYEVFFVEHAVSILKDKKLKLKYDAYKHKLCTYFEKEIKSYEWKKVSIPSMQDLSHIAVVVKREQVLLSLIIHLKEYFATYLGFHTCLLDGFTEGCTVVYLTATTLSPSLLYSRILPCLTELRQFSVAYLVVFGHFVVDVDQPTNVIMVSSKLTVLLKPAI